MFSYGCFAQVVHELSADRFTHYRPDDWISYANSLQISSVEMDEDYVYFASNGGILRYDRIMNRWSYPFTSSNGLRNNAVKKVVYDHENGILYALTSTGIDEYNRADNYWKPSGRRTLPVQKQVSVVDKKGNEIYFPPYSRPKNKQLPNFFMSEAGFLFEKPDIIIDNHFREYRLTDRIADQYRRIWFGSNYFGPFVGDLFSQTMTPLFQSMSFVEPRALYIDGDNMWVGGQTRADLPSGINAWNRDTNIWTYYESPFISSLKNDHVHAIDGNKKFVVFATDLGVVIYTRKNRKWKTLSLLDGLRSDKTYDVLVFNEQAFVATEYGLNWINLNSGRIYEPRSTILDNVRINRLAVSDTLIWMASKFGLYSFNPADEKILFHKPQVKLPDYNPTSIDRINNEIWLANDAGIYTFNFVSGKWQDFSNLNFKARFRDINHTKHAVWFATDRGLLKYEPEKNYWRLFTVRDGLLSNELFRIDVENEYLWITSGEGLTRFLYKSKRRID